MNSTKLYLSNILWYVSSYWQPRASRTDFCNSCCAYSYQWCFLGKSAQPRRSEGSYLLLCLLWHRWGAQWQWLSLFIPRLVVAVLLGSSPPHWQSWYKYLVRQCWANRNMKTFQEACVEKAWIHSVFQAIWQTPHTLSPTTLCHRYTIPKTFAVWLVCFLPFAELNIVPHQWQRYLSGMLPHIPCTTCFYGEIRHTDTLIPPGTTESAQAWNSTCIGLSPKSTSIGTYSWGASGTHMLEMPSGKEWRSQPRLCGVIDVLYFCLGHSYYKLPSANCIHSCLRAWGTISVLISSLIWKTKKGHGQKLGCLVLTAIASRMQLTWALILKDSTKEGL